MLLTMMPTLSQTQKQVFEFVPRLVRSQFMRGASAQDTNSSALFAKQINKSSSEGASVYF